MNEKGIMVQQQILYEWKPTLCTGCGGIGHSVEECKKKAQTKMWVPKQECQRVDKTVTQDIAKDVQEGDKMDSPPRG